MILYYKHILVGLPEDQALQTAQQELSRGPIEVLAHPLLVGPFQLYADRQRVAEGGLVPFLPEPRV